MNESRIFQYIEGRLIELNVLMPKGYVKIVLGLFCEAVLKGMAEEGKARIQGFGTFAAKSRKVAFNFDTSNKVAELKCVSFKPSRRFVSTMRRLLNGEKMFP